MTDAPKKAKKVAPPTDMAAHNEELKKATTATQEKPMPTETNLLNTTEVAKALDTTPRELRKFLRSEKSGIEAVGQGKRYALPESRVTALAKKFDAWKKADDEAKAKKRDEKAKAEKEVDGELEIEPTDDDSDDAEVEEITFAEGEEIDFEEIDDEEPRWTRDDLETMKVKSLRDLATELKVDTVNSKSTKSEIIDAILAQ